MAGSDKAQAHGEEESPDMHSDLNLVLEAGRATRELAAVSCQGWLSAQGCAWGLPCKVGLPAMLTAAPPARVSCPGVTAWIPSGTGSCESCTQKYQGCPSHARRSLSEVAAATPAYCEARPSCCWLSRIFLQAPTLLLSRSTNAGANARAVQENNNKPAHQPWQQGKQV